MDCSIYGPITLNHQFHQNNYFLWCLHLHNYTVNTHRSQKHYSMLHEKLCCFRSPLWIRGMATRSEGKLKAFILQEHSSSVCAPHGLVQFKTEHRLSLSKSRLSKTCSSVDASCNRCLYSPATLAHILVLFQALRFLEFRIQCFYENIWKKGFNLKVTLYQTATQSMHCSSAR